MTYSPNGQYLVISSLDSVHRLFSLGNRGSVEEPDNPKFLRHFKSHSNKRYSIFSSVSLFCEGDILGSYIVSGSEDNMVRNWAFWSSLFSTTSQTFMWIFFVRYTCGIWTQHRILRLFLKDIQVTLQSYQFTWHSFFCCIWSNLLPFRRHSSCSCLSSRSVYESNCLR